MVCILACTFIAFVWPWLRVQGIDNKKALTEYWLGAGNCSFVLSLCRATGRWKFLHAKKLFKIIATINPLKISTLKKIFPDQWIAVLTNGEVRNLKTEEGIRRFQSQSLKEDMIYLSNRPQVSMVYSLINHAGCWKNTRRICKSKKPTLLGLLREEYRLHL